MRRSTHRKEPLSSSFMGNLPDARLRSPTHNSMGGRLPGDAAREQLDAGDEEPSLCAFDRCFEVLCEAPVSIEPGDGALHHPVPWQWFEADGRLVPYYR